MALTAAELATIKRRTNESANAMVSDADIQLIADQDGLVLDSTDLGPLDTGYTATYDLNAVAAEIWREKAGMVAAGFDFTAEGASFTRSQTYRHYMEMATYRAGLISNLSV